MLLGAVSAAAEELGTEWFVCGASARVFVCEDMKGMRPGRATGDLDFGVCVNTMAEYENLRQLLRNKYDFMPDPDRQAQRLIYRRNRSTIDVIPFGDFTGASKTFRWGEDDGFKMNVLGFEEAYNSSITLTVNESITIRVASYAEQFSLKLLAWEDRHTDRKEYEDSRDLAYFLQHAEDWYGLDFLHDEFPLELEKFDYEIRDAAAFALGCDLALSFGEVSLERITGILRTARDDPDSLLVREVAIELPYSNREERAHRLLEIVLEGISSKC